MSMSFSQRQQSQTVKFGLLASSWLLRPFVSALSQSSPARGNRDVFLSPDVSLSLPLSNFPGVNYSLFGTACAGLTADVGVNTSEYMLSLANRKKISKQ